MNFKICLFYDLLYRENEDYHLNNAIGDNKNNNISNNDNLIDKEDIDLLNSDISFKV